MSLINDMLRDLDARNAADSERSGLANNVRALPNQRERRVHPALLALSMLVLAGGLAWRLLQPVEPKHAPVQAKPTAAVPETPVLTATEDAPTPVPPIEQALNHTEPAAGATAPASETQAATHLRLETSISNPPAPKSASAPVDAATAAAPIMPKVVAAVPVDAAPQATLPSTNAKPRNTTAAQISKQPTQAGSTTEQAEAEYQRAVAALQRGAAGEAGDLLRSALKLNPAHIAARQTLLSQLVEQKQWQNAETLALDGVGLLPHRSDWAMLAARIMYEQGETDEALDTLNQYAAAGRQNTDYQILHALLLQRAGRNSDAANCYRTALALRPNEGRWWYGLGRALDADRRDAEARQAFEKAREAGNLPAELQQSIERRLRQP